MATSKRIFDISNLIFRKLAGTCSDEENVELERWVNVSKRNKSLYTRVFSDEVMADKIRQYRNEDVQLAFEEFVRRREQLELRKRQKIRLIRYAAILILPLVVSMWYLVHEKETEKTFTAQTSENIMGNGFPVLTLSNGEELILAEQNLALKERNGTRITMETKNGMRYSASDSVREENVYNILATPAQCDFMFTLADGTKVWLNAQSSLRYPVSFTGKERVVYASGEVYLEVAEDVQHPFYVVLENDMKIKVLGTSFNVNTYHDAEVTLVTGRIKAEYKNGEKEWVLRPGNQLRMEGNEATINTVNVNDYITWKDGMYIFKERKLEFIAETIERWYGMKFIFLDEKGKTEVFTGILDKHVGLEVFVHQLSKASGLKCLISEGQLFIKSNN